MSGLPVGDGEDCDIRGTAAKKASDVIARNGVFEIGRGS
jgi:hypothetical protein